MELLSAVGTSSADNCSGLSGFAHAQQLSRDWPDSAGNVKKADLLRMRIVERANRLGSRLQQDRATLFCKIRLSFRRQMHVAHLTRAKNQLLASLLKDELRFVLREDMRGAVVLLRQFRLATSPDRRMITSCS